MKYGIYRASLSIGHSGADRREDIDITEEYEEDEWNEMSEDEQDKILREWMDDILGQYIEMSYEEPV